ncbi:hypothetical protein CY34DRAFT_810251 [Suillus luteus UH-Slu-Lm8-n1]|uniref:Uncharacterized protein n=1 Tax=Suillus luteus UH-Slu-Lm8-n1 TaxID=930992 RepID=A0A0D0A7G0_9AGAM|nr:hypothetical protein CY34DRAFT_810251 [Suillus luteus UH-Slu-Lm8-n1]
MGVCYDRSGILTTVYVTYIGIPVAHFQTSSDVGRVAASAQTQIVNVLKSNRAEWCG